MGKPWASSREVNSELEYVGISADTTEADLKQCLGGHYGAAVDARMVGGPHVESILGGPVVPSLLKFGASAFQKNMTIHREFI